MKVGAQVSDMYLGNFTKYLILMLAVSHLVNQDVLSSSMHALTM